MPSRPIIAAIRATAVALALAGAGCAGDANPVRDAFNYVGVGDRVAKPRRFVVESRPEPGGIDYIPAGAAPRTRAKPKPVDVVKQSEAQLDRVREANEQAGAAARAAGATPAPTPPVVPPLPPGSE